MANDLLIKINADAKNAKKEFDNIREQTEDLEGQLKNVALISGAAFAALTAEIYFSVKAFEEARAASVQLTNALQNQGIYTEELRESYDQYAKAVQAKTGIDDDAITKAQAVAQTFLGQTKITEELSFAIADLGASMGGDLNGAAEKIARTIGTGSNAFAKQGLVISASATEAERYAKVLEFVQAKSGGLAEELNKADGYSKALSTSFGNFQESIGARFAPIVELGRKALIGLFDTFSNNPLLTDFVVAAIAAGAVVTGLITVVAAAIPVILSLKAAMVAFGIAFNASFVGIPLIIGAVVAAVTLLALNWDKVMATIKAATSAAVTLVSELFGGLAKVLSGVWNNFNTKQISAGIDQITGSFKKTKDAAVETYVAITAAQAEEGAKQDAKKKALANKEAAQERLHQANLRAIRQAEIDLIRMQNENASAAMIALKQKEIEVLKALDSEKSAEEMALFQERREEIKQLQDEQFAEDQERALAFAQLEAEMKAEIDAQKIAIDAQIREDRLTQLRATALTENDIDRQLQEEILTRRINARNQELADRKKYGEAYAKINKALNSDEVQGTKDAAGELVQLQQSKNATLKTIGKVAAVASITISTAESAMNIFRGFSTIPIVGPALGVAGAAAAVAFGAERIGQVTGAAEGALVMGGVPGRDSVPFMLEPGELVTPKKNFEEVVGGVQMQRQGLDNTEMVDILRSIDSKFATPTINNINGDVMADDAFINVLLAKINDALEFKNQRLFGVSA